MKKILAFVLALAMVLGMATMGTRSRTLGFIVLILVQFLLLLLVFGLADGTTHDGTARHTHNGSNIRATRTTGYAANG